MNDKYLFLAIPPYSGSTVMHNYLASCSDVAKLVIKDSLDPYFVEGNAVAAKSYFVGGGRLRATMPGSIIGPGNHQNIYSNEVYYNFNTIKTIWDKNWKENFPDKTIKLQKTPDDVYRVELMRRYFRKSKWIISVREPYSWAMSTIAKLAYVGINPVDNFDKLCTHITNTYHIQKQNVEFLKEDAYTATHEQLVANPELHAEGIRNFIPELTDFTFNKEVWVKKKLYTGLESNNEQRIQELRNLSGAMNRLTNYLKDHREILNYWGYDIIE